MYEIVKQKDKGYYTIFNGNDQLCDADGNPIRFKDIKKANKCLEDILEDDTLANTPFDDRGDYYE